MATGDNGSKVRLVVLVVVLLGVAAFGWYKFAPGAQGAAGGGVEMKIINGDFAGGPLDDVTAALGAQPVEQTNPDGEKSTAKIYLYTLAGGNPDRQFVRARVAANGKVLYTRYVDAAGNEVVIEKNR